MSGASDLTLELLKEQYGFEVFDLGDFWQCEKDNLVLVQVKSDHVTLPFITAESKPKTITTIEELEKCLKLK